MDKNELLARVEAALQEMECPVEAIEEQPGLQWFMALSEDYQKDYAVGELFFASDLTDEDMNGVEVVQLNIVFKREINPERIDALRAFFSRVNRQITGGRFDAQQEDTCFAEYGHDVILPLDITDDQAEHTVVSALGLMAAYISFVYEGVTGIVEGAITSEQAMKMLV